MAEPISGVTQQTAAVPPLKSATESISERPLSEFLAEARANTMMNGRTSALANPAALSGELVKRLQGFFERSASYEKIRNGGANMEQTDLQLASLTEQPQEEKVHSGPAREALLPTERTKERTGDLSVTVDELRRLSELMNKMMGFSAEIQFVSSAVTNVTGSVRTLTRGQ